MEFKDWLMTEKNYSDRASRDVQSRIKRALAFTDEAEISPETLSKIETNTEFKGLSMSVKSQLRRGIRLYNEYKLLIK